MVQAVAGNSAFDGARRGQEVFYKIPSEDWERVETADILWITGELTYRRREFGSEYTTVRHYNVRFKPQGVHDIVKSVSQTDATELASRTDVDPEPKGPRVSDAHLQAWFEFYKKVHTEAEDTEDRALESARLNFPGKSVSRDRVRALRGSLRRGPKRKPE
jgi:hypothetical protein